jgi:flagellar secretion chaperone FliS
MTYAAKKYAETKLNTSVNIASSKELIGMVYEKIFEHLKNGKIELENTRYGVESFTKASELINLGLLASLDLTKGGEIALNLKKIYEWSIFAILDARVKREPEKIQDVINVLSLLYEGWTSKEFLERS